MYLRGCLCHARPGMLKLIYPIENGMVQASRQIWHQQVVMHLASWDAEQAVPAVLQLDVAEHAVPNAVHKTKAHYL